MASIINTDNLALGLGTLEFGEFVNGAFVAYRYVGAIKATVNLALTRETQFFETGRPLQEVKREVIREFAEITCTLAEVTAANLKAALGGGTVTSSTTPTFLTGNAQAPTGELTDSVTTVGVSDVVSIGGQCAMNNLAIRFTRQKSCITGKRQIIEVFKAVPTGTLTLPFAETDYTQYEVSFRGLADTTRAAGNQILQVVIERE